MAPGQGTGFVSVGQYLDANQGTLANETSGIVSDLAREQEGAKSAANSVISSDKAPGGYQKDYTQLSGYGDALDRAIGARDRGAAIQTEGGLAGYFKKSRGDSDSQSHFDAGLLGGNEQITSVGKNGVGLVDYLNGGLAGVAAPPPPPKVVTQPPPNERPAHPEPGGPGVAHGGDNPNNPVDGHRPAGGWNNLPGLDDYLNQGAVGAWNAKNAGAGTGQPYPVGQPPGEQAEADTSKKRRGGGA